MNEKRASTAAAPTSPTNSNGQQQRNSSSLTRHSSSTTPTRTTTTTSLQRMAPSSVVANQSQNIPAPECCCFSARFVNLVLYLFNFIFLLSGICILLLTLLYGRPEVSRYLGETTKYLNNIISLLGSGHLVQVIHYSMLFCGIVIIIISLLNICFSTATSWSKSSDYYYYHRRRKRQDNESLLYLNDNDDGGRQQSNHAGSRFIDSSIDKRRSNAYLNNQQDDSMLIMDDSKADDSLQIHNDGSTSSPSSSSSSTMNKHNKHYRNHQESTFVRQRLRRNGQCDESKWSHIANSATVLCCYIFTLVFLFTIQLVIGLLSVITVSPEHVFISTHTAASDDFLVSVRESVDIQDLLVNRASDIEQLYEPFHCCGWIYFNDYEYLHNPDVRNKSISVPDSCCKTYKKNCGSRKHPNNIYYDGCWSKFGSEMRDYVLMLGWTALGFAVIELIGIMFAVCHYVQIISKT